LTVRDVHHAHLGGTIMKTLIRSVFVTFIVLAAASVAEADSTPRPETRLESAREHENAVSAQSCEGDVDLGCTISCSFWNLCRARNLGNPQDCGDEPSDCNCTSFN
jgi:hypothetical protein